MWIFSFCMDCFGLDALGDDVSKAVSHIGL